MTTFLWMWSFFYLRPSNGDSKYTTWQ